MSKSRDHGQCSTFKQRMAYCGQDLVLFDGSEYRPKEVLSTVQRKSMHSYGAVAAGKTTPAMSTIKLLQEELLCCVLQFVPDLCSILNARQATRLLRGPASDFVKGLQAADAEVPQHVWDAFSKAIKCKAYRTLQGDVEIFLHNLGRLILALPARLQELHVCSALKLNAYDQLTANQSRLFASSLLASALNNSLHVLKLQLGISSNAADVLLGHLKGLQHVELWVYHVAGMTWRPAADLSHIKGSLAIRMDDDSNQDSDDHDANEEEDGEEEEEGAAFIDLEGIGSAASLRQLSVTPGWRVINMRALAKLRCLQELTLDAYDDGGMRLAGEDLDAIAQLAHLRRLSATGGGCSAEHWDRIAGLPQLQEVLLQGVMMDISSEVVSGITSLRHATRDTKDLWQVSCTRVWLRAEQQQGGEDAGEQEEQQLLAGFLARHLPKLQHADIAGNDLLRLATALQGHTALRSFRYEATDADAEWPQQLLRTLPALETLVLSEVDRDMQALLADVSGCSKLTALYVGGSFKYKVPRTAVPAAALAALVSGPAAASLVELHLLLAPCVVVPEAVALLVRSMPALRKAVLTLVPPRGMGPSEVGSMVEGAARGAEGPGGSRVWRAQAAVAPEPFSVSLVVPMMVATLEASVPQV